MSAAAGFFLGSKGEIDGVLLLATLSGISLVIACACVLNNYIDRDIDKKMARTKNRAIPAGKVSRSSALAYAGLLGSAGFFILAVFTNLLSVLLGVAALVIYVVVYGAAKRNSQHGTIVGSLAGALPPVAGYTAVADRIDTAAILLFLIMVFWQMPHFYAIAVFRSKEYKAAKIPVLPLKKGMKETKIQILVYIIGFIAAASLLTAFGYTGYVYLVVILAVGLKWLELAARGFRAANDEVWARGLFRFSLIVLLVFCVTLSVDSLVLSA